MTTKTIIVQEIGQRMNGPSIWNKPIDLYRRNETKLAYLSIRQIISNELAGDTHPPIKLFFISFS